MVDTTVKEALCVLVTVKFCGWVAIIGATMTCSVMFVLAVPATLLAMREYTKPSCENCTFVKTNGTSVAPGIGVTPISHTIVGVGEPAIDALKVPLLP